MATCHWARQPPWGIGDHWPVDERSYSKYKGAWFGLFRRPVRRAWSLYNYFSVRTQQEISFERFRRQVAGQAVKQLAGQAHGLECNTMAGQGVVSHCRNTSQLVPDVATAVARMNGFAFVGLTDEYRRSICLLHAMFGGDCLAFESVRASD